MAASVTYDATTYKWVAVKLTAQAPTYFGGANNGIAPLLSATSTATLSGATPSTPPACVVALGTSGNTTIPDNSGAPTAAVVTAYCNAATIISGDVGGPTKCTSANVTVTPSTITAGQPITVTATYTCAPPSGYAAGFTPQFISTILNAIGKIRVLH